METSTIVILFAAWKVRKLTKTEIAKLQAFVDEVGDYWLICDAVSNAIDSKATYATIGKAIAYVRSIVEQCREEGRRPGETVTAKTVREKEKTKRLDRTTEAIDRREEQRRAEQCDADERARSDADKARARVNMIGAESVRKCLGREFKKSGPFSPLPEPKDDDPAKFSIYAIYSFLDWMDGKPPEEIEALTKKRKTTNKKASQHHD